MKSFISSLLFLFFVVGFAQKDFQGKAIYQSKTTMDMDRFPTDMSEQRKKEIKERMKSMLEKTYILNFNKIASTYKEEEKLATPTAGRGFRFGGFSGGGLKYKNTSDKKMLESNEFFGKKFLITEDLEMPQWEMTAETKKIGNYTCYKATYTKDASNMITMGPPPRGKRNKNDTKEDEAPKTPKKITVTAWYTPQIPVSNGPESYWGLPGLILEINAGRTTILCTEVTLNTTEKEAIVAPTKGKKVTRKEYNKIVKNKMEEMRERFRGRRGNGGPPPRG